ncbi:Kelch-Like Protein 31 [Manis pentadactyla]|nr:Kelch-Like Protein 31 [Manis pentadactyla]
MDLYGSSVDLNSNKQKMIRSRRPHPAAGCPAMPLLRAPLAACLGANRPSPNTSSRTRSRRRTGLPSTPHRHLWLRNQAASLTQKITSPEPASVTVGIGSNGVRGLHCRLCLLGGAIWKESQMLKRKHYINAFHSFSKIFEPPKNDF